MNILVADDDEMGLKTLCDALILWGHAPLAARDGAEAWRLFDRHRATLDLAILDWMMPEMDGLTLCRRIRESATHYIHLIMLTGRGHTEDVIAGLKTGANDYVTKPYELDELQARINVGGRIVGLEHELTRRIAELETALAQVKHLQGLLPICSYCKKIRADRDYWQEVEGYVAEHAEVRFSHCICPDCFTTVVEPELRRMEAAPA